VFSGFAGHRQAIETESASWSKFVVRPGAAGPSPRRSMPGRGVGSDILTKAMEKVRPPGGGFLSRGVITILRRIQNGRGPSGPVEILRRQPRPKDS